MGQVGTAQPVGPPVSPGSLWDLVSESRVMGTQEAVRLAQRPCHDQHPHRGSTSSAPSSKPKSTVITHVSAAGNAAGGPFSATALLL